MKLDRARVVLRPRTGAEVFDLGMRWTIAVGGALYLRLSTIVLLPSLALCLLARHAWGWDWLSVWLLAVALSTVSQGVFTVAAGKLLLDPKPSTREVLWGFVRRLPVYLEALVITRIGLGLAGLVAVMLPWVWAWVAFVHEACLLEGAGPIAGIRRASRFVRGDGGSAMLMLLGLGCGLVTAVFVAEFIGTSLVGFVLQLGNVFDVLWIDGGSPWALLGFHVAIPYLASVRFLKYIDGRTRRDGWDIQLRFIAIEFADAQARKPHGAAA
jgi:hypothetical protein